LNSSIREQQIWIGIGGKIEEKKKKKLRERREMGNSAPRTNMLGNARKVL